MHGMRWRDALEIIEEQKSQAYWSNMARERLAQCIELGKTDDVRVDYEAMARYCQAQSRKAVRNMMAIRDEIAFLPEFRER